MSGGDYIAIDWGTTNRRIYVMQADGTVRASWRDDRGVLALENGDFAREVAVLREQHGALPVIAAGMVTSSRGWHEVPYCDAPADIPSLGRGVVKLAGEDVTLTPGVAQRGLGRADVMRGEEVQVLGAIAAGLAPGDGLFCQPGTHNKWIACEGGRIVGFSTALTGELFALLKDRSVLAEMLRGDVSDGPAFREGVQRGRGATDLPVAIFGVRAAVLLGDLDAAQAASYASGLLIGADVGGRDDIAGREVLLLASGPLADLYAAAIHECGGTVRLLDSHAAFAAGIHRLRELTA